MPPRAYASWRDRLEPAPTCRPFDIEGRWTENCYRNLIGLIQQEVFDPRVDRTLESGETWHDNDS